MEYSDLIKQITLKQVLLFLGGLIGLAVLGVGCFALYIIIPSGLQSSFAKGPEVLTELMAMAEESQPFNPDPYIASTYRPDNPLYEPVLNVQRERWDLAEKQLQPLVKQNNVDAMFWLAEITYGGYYDSSRAAELYQKSAKLGNPYSALKLDDDSYICQKFMAYYCDKKWGELGRKLLQDRADKGDLKAAFYRVKIDINEQSSSVEEWQKLVKLATENAKKYYYQPLYWLLKQYMYKNYYPKLKENSPLSLEQKKIIVKIATIAANNNFPPIMRNYVFSWRSFLPNKYLSSNIFIPKFVSQLMHLDLHSTVYQDYYAALNQPRSEVLKGASYAVAQDFIKDRRNLAVYEYVMSKKGLKPLTKNEIKQAKAVAPKILKQMTPVIYIDEMTPSSLY